MAPYFLANNNSCVMFLKKHTYIQMYSYLLSFFKSSEKKAFYGWKRCFWFNVAEKCAAENICSEQQYIFSAKKHIKSESTIQKLLSNVQVWAKWIVLFTIIITTAAQKAFLGFKKHTHMCYDVQYYRSFLWF